MNDVIFLLNGEHIKSGFTIAFFFLAIEWKLRLLSFKKNKKVLWKHESSFTCVQYIRCSKAKW